MKKNFEPELGIRSIHVILGLAFLALCVVGGVLDLAENTKNFSWPAFWSITVSVIFFVVMFNVAAKNR